MLKNNFDFFIIKIIFIYKDIYKDIHKLHINTYFFIFLYKKIIIKINKM
jgi:hypothetical protein